MKVLITNLCIIQISDLMFDIPKIFKLYEEYYFYYLSLIACLSKQKYAF